MKKTLLIFTILFISILGISQDNAIDKYYQHYANQEEFTKVTISGKMFELFTYLETDDEDAKEVLNTIKKLSGMKMLICDSLGNGVSEYKSALTKMPKEYEVLMTIDDEDEDLTFLIKETKGIVSELLLVGGGEDNLFILSLYGIIDLKQISKLASHVNIEGLEHLKHVGE